MKKTNNHHINALLAFTGILGCATGLAIGVTKTLNVFKASGNAYSLLLQSAKLNPSSTAPSGEASQTIQTVNGNNVTFSYANVINYSGGWQTIKPGGYFYNPVTNSGTNNKITDVTSVRFESGSSSTLSFYFGYSLNNSDIIWSQERTITNNSTFNIPTGEHPNYIRVENSGSSNVNISNFTINYSCSVQSYPRQTYNVLMIGNSYSDDTIYYAGSIANSYGITFNIFDAYVASCTIDMHLSNINNSSASYVMRATNGASQLSNVTLQTILNNRTWDAITFQQGSSDSGVASTYNNLSSLITAVRNIVGSGPKLYWYQTWAYSNEYSGENDNYTAFSKYNNDQLTMLSSINSAYTSKVQSLISDFIPAGTVVQNMRTSYLGDSLCKDGKHMSSVQGRYLLGLNLFSNIFDVDLSKSPCSYKPTEANDSYKITCYEAIRNAHKTPRSVTNSVYTTLPEQAAVDLTNYTEIDAEMVGCSYWNSSDSSNYGIRITNNNQFVSTKRFTQAELPIGSLIFIDESIGYRPEAWTSNSQQSTRPAEAYANYIEVNSAFWSGYQYRAFNLFKIGKPTLNGQHYQIFDGFHIYVPNASLGSIHPKDYNSFASTDVEYFKSSGLNFNSFKRMQLDPIYGYYNSTNKIDLTQIYNDSTAKKFLCTRAFNTNEGDLPENTVIIVDSGYQWRPDAWHASGLTGAEPERPANITDTVTVLDSTFMSSWRRRAINLSPTNGTETGQNFITRMSCLRIYTPIPNANIYADVSDTSDIGANYPVGTFKGTAIANMGGDDIYLDLVISVGHFSGTSTTQVVVMASNTDAQASKLTFNSSSNAISISTSGSYMLQSFGTITGTYNKTTNQITGVGCSGKIKTYITNNNSIVVERPTSYFFGCEGTNDVLQTKFKHRSGDPWKVDFDSDRITRNTSTYVSGSGAATCKGNSSKRVGFSLSRDIDNTQVVKNFHCWVYNPSSSAVTVRVWVYKGRNYSNNAELISGGKSLSAGKWTYIAVGFTEGEVYNFQIADFTNSGVNLTFDNILLF